MEAIPVPGVEALHRGGVDKDDPSIGSAYRTCL
jgi:hypothetical protein